jgi:hypothetical protein
MLARLLKNGLSLAATGNPNRSFYFAENVGVARFDLGAEDFCIGRNGIQVALDGVGSGLLDLLGVFGPAAEGRSVKAGDDWNIDSGFRFADVIEIFFGAGVEFAGVGEVGERFGKALGTGVEMEFEFERLLVELLFEEREEHDGRCAGVFEGADSGDFVGERGRGGDERSAQLHA